jgi:hypothetical protein
MHHRSTLFYAQRVGMGRKRRHVDLGMMSGCPDPGCRFFESGRFWKIPPLPPSSAGVMLARIGGTPPRGIPSIRGLTYRHIPRLKQDNDRPAPNTLAPLVASSMVSARCCPALVKGVMDGYIRGSWMCLVTQGCLYWPRAALSPQLHVGPRVGNSVGTWEYSCGLGNGKVVAKPPRIRT